MYKMQGQPPPGRRKKVAPTASPHKDQPTPQPATGPILNGAMGAGVSGGGVSYLKLPSILKNTTYTQGVN